MYYAYLQRDTLTYILSFDTARDRDTFSARCGSMQYVESKDIPTHAKRTLKYSHSRQRCPYTLVTYDIALLRG